MAGEFLRVTRGPREGAEIRVAEGELELGREVDGPGYLGEDDRLSRRHARLLRADDGGLLVEDLGSLNGTLVNGVPATGAQRLAPGDVLGVGGAQLVVLDAQGRGAQATSSGAPAPRVPAPVPAKAGPRRGAVVDAQVIAVAALLLAVAVVVLLLVR